MRLPLLVLHVTAGTLGILSGFAAIFLRKGSWQHRVAGNVFVVSMLAMSASATYLAFVKHQINNVCGGILTGYLVATAWMTARRRNVETGVFDWIALLVALAVGATIISYGVIVASNPAPPHDGVPVGMYFFMGSVALLSGAGDVRIMARGGISGTQRLVRHLWRMSFALFNAAGSLFLGQQQVFPAFLRHSNVLLIPAFLPLLLMIFWLLRVRFTNTYQAKAISRAGDAYSLFQPTHE